MGNCFVYDTLSVYGMELIKKTTYQKEITQEVDLTIPNVYSEIPNTITGSDNVMDYIGLDIQTYYRYEPQYIQIGRQYLNFKSVILPTGQLSDLDNLSESATSSITTISGYDESVSAVKNFNFWNRNHDYYNYNYYSAVYGPLGGIGQFASFYEYNTSIGIMSSLSSDFPLWSNWSLSYLDSIHVMSFSKKYFNFDYFTLKNFEIYRYMHDTSLNQIIKYNYVNNLRYTEYYKLLSVRKSGGSEVDDQPLNFIFPIGIIYENGIFILNTPFVQRNTLESSSSIIVSTCLGYLNGITSGDKYTYNWSIDSSLSTSLNYGTYSSGAYDSATASMAITALNIGIINKKDYLTCNIKLPKEYYNISDQKLNSDGTSKKKSVYISKLIFYNERNEVMAVAKLSKPIPKNEIKEYLFSVDIQF